VYAVISAVFVLRPYVQVEDDVAHSALAN